MAASGMLLSHIADMYTLPVKELHADWQPHQYVMVWIPPTLFKTAKPTSWKEMKRDCDTFIILQMLASIISRKDMGDMSNRDDPYYFGEHIPKTVQILEELTGPTRRGNGKSRGNGNNNNDNDRSEGEEEEEEDDDDDDDEDEGQFMGFYLWVFVNDPDYDLSKGMLDLVLANSKRSQDVTGGARAGGANGARDQDTDLTAFHAVKEREGLAALWARYTERNEMRNVGDALHSAENAIDAEDSLINPLNVLTAQNAIRQVPLGVCEEQRREETYFDTNNGLTATSFRRQFPRPERTSRIGTVHFTVKGVSCASLPCHLRNWFAPRERELDRLRREADEATEQLESGRAESAAEKDELEYTLLEAQETIRLRVDEIADMNRNIQRNNNGEQTGLFLSTGEIDEQLAERNDFMKLAQDNTVELERLKKLLPGTTEHEEAMTAFRRGAVRRFWHVFMTSENITQAAMSVRKWFKKLPPEKHWIENNQITPGLSLYGNMIIRMTTSMDKVFKVETNFSLALLAMAVKYCAYRFWWGLRPNLLLTGDGATGKSFILDLMEKLSVPGTTLNATHITQHAFQTDEDMSDITLIIHEMPPGMLGVDQYGNTMSADPYFKNRLTKQLTVTIHPVKDSKTRKVTVSFSRCMGNTVAALNEKLPSDKTPAMSRFIRHSMAKTSRVDTDPDDMVFMMDCADDTDLEDTILHGFRLYDFYVFTLEKAIESKALPDVDIGAAQMVSRWVFKELAAAGVARPQRRHISMYFDICRVFTLVAAPEAEFFSELGLGHREHQNGKPKDFRPECLVDIPRWFVCTQEIAVHWLTLMEHIWIPTLKSKIVDAIAYNLVRHASSRNETQDKWIATSGANAGGFGHASAGTQFKKDNTGVANEMTEDLNYITVVGESYKSIASRVVVHLREKPSTNDILGSIIAMQYEYISSRAKHWVQIWFDKSGVNVDDYGKHRQVLDEATTAAAAGAAEAKAARDAAFAKRCSLCPNSEVFKSAQDLAEHARQWMQQWEREHGDPGELHQIIRLVSDETEPRRQIPCVILDEDPGGRKRKRLCIAVDMINQDLNGLLRSCIPKALEHANQPPACYITGFPYTRLKEESGKEGHAPEHQSYCNIFDTIKLKQGDTWKVMQNPYSYSAAEIHALYNRLGTRERGSGLTALQTTPASALDMQLDYVHWAAHCLKHGLPLEGSYRSYPRETHRLVWKERMENSRYKSINHMIVRKYPEEWVEALDNKTRERQKLEERVGRLRSGDECPADIHKYSFLRTMKGCEQDKETTEIVHERIALASKRLNINEGLDVIDPDLLPREHEHEHEHEHEQEYEHEYEYEQEQEQEQEYEREHAQAGRKRNRDDNSDNDDIFNENINTVDSFHRSGTGSHRRSKRMRTSASASASASASTYYASTVQWETSTVQWETPPPSPVSPL